MNETAKTFSVLDRIAACQARMPASLTKIAAVITDDPKAPLTLTITGLAERAGTSPATVTRFARLLGYASFSELRIALAEDAGRGRSDDAWIADMSRTIGPDDPPEKICSALLKTHMLSLQTTASMIDMAAAMRVAQVIARSRHVDFYGVGGSALAAQEAKGRLYRIGFGVQAWSDIHGGLGSAAILDKHCVAIGISNTGHTDETIQMLMVAKATGAHTVAITANPDSPLARLADDTLIAASPNGYFQPSDLSARHSQLFVVNLLYLLIAQLAFDRTSRLLAASAAAVAPRRRPMRRAPPPAPSMHRVTPPEFIKQASEA